MEGDDDEGLPRGGTWTASIHPQSIPGALKVQQEVIGKLQRTLRQELAKLQAEEAILKLMIKRERGRLARQERRRGPARGADAQQRQQQRQQQQEEGKKEGEVEGGGIADEQPAAPLPGGVFGRLQASVGAV